MTKLPATMNFIDHGKGGGPDVMALAQTALPSLERRSPGAEGV